MDRELPSELVLLHCILMDHFGDPHWWPGETSFEVCVGAILTQNTAWSNVERAVQNLKERELLDPFKALSVPLHELASAIRPAGHFNQKAVYLKAFCSFLVEGYGGSIERMGRAPTQEVRGRLLGVRGIGEETADSILCYALGRPVLVMDLYTYRTIGRVFGVRVPLLKPGGKGAYGRSQAVLMGLLQGDPLFYNRFHALLVLLAKETCRKVPSCPNCSLRDVCGQGRHR